ncbi:MAG: hypothetical protein NC131_10015 [Roseburia sp.]|nr:hypothetical protein [Roseburia sp.]
MYGWNEYHPVWVITTDGVKEISSLSPGDQLYEYQTKQMMTVLEVLRPEPKKIFEVEYVDGRKAKFMEDDPIYIGCQKTTRPMDIIQGKKLGYPYPMITFNGGFGSIPYDAIDYMQSSYPHQKPDPYTAGVLFTFAAYDRDEIGLPEWTNKTHDHICNNYHLKYSYKLNANGDYFFTPVGGDGHALRWDEFFPTQRCFAKSSAFVDPIIPKEYKWGTLADRWNYVRGAMDAGFDPNIFIDGVGCASTDEVRMKELQKIMWGIGIMSELRYDPQSSKKRPWILELIGRYSRYPGVFNHPDNINWAVHLDNHIMDQLPIQMLTITSMRYLTTGTVPNIKVDGWPKMYYSADFLPRVTA